MSKVLVACEESQRVCKAFRELGHEAYSCDIEPCSGGHPEWHIQDDVLKYLNEDWDLIIAHPPCTHLTVSGARHFEKKRLDGRQRKGIEFFCKFLECDCPRVAIENPVGIISGEYIKKYFPDLCERYGLPLRPTQKIQPFEFGHPYTKTTCLWLKGLPKLEPTNILEKPESGWVNQSITPDGRYGGFNGKFHSAKERSKTFEGIAKAMAEQWGRLLNE
jgi:site-specific DNA-cytosine methylase